MKDYGIHLSNTLSQSVNNQFGNECANFYEYLVEEVHEIHSVDVTDDSKNLKILKFYNPEEGIAYYFTEH